MIFGHNLQPVCVKCLNYLDHFNIFIKVSMQVSQNFVVLFFNDQVHFSISFFLLWIWNKFSKFDIVATID
jgi:hypothetical protein